MFKTIASRRLRLTLVSTLVLAACGGGGGATESALSTQSSTNAGTGSAATPSGTLTFIDRSIALPVGRAGSNSAIRKPATVAPYPQTDNVGSFRTVCFFSHMSYDDPIVYPGGAGRAHLHSFFGNKGADANSTLDSIANQGASTCRGGILNRSSYWVPSMIAPGGVPMAPYDIVVYYKTGFQGARNEDVIVPPVGLRIIGGNSKATSPQPREHVAFGCAPFAEGDIGAQLLDDRVPTCQPGQQMMMRVDYPQCWDGQNLTSPDGRSHMAYGDYLRGCPAGFPVVIPAITFTVKWRVPNGTSTAGWRLSSDVDGAPAGSSAHADWWNGWDLDTKTTWVRRCVNTGMDCGTYLLGDGNMLDDN